MSEINSDPHHKTNIGFGNDDNKIPTNAFLKCSQSSAAEESDWGTVTVSIICAYAVCGGRERGRKVVTLTALFQNFQFGDMAFQVYTH